MSANKKISSATKKQMNMPNLSNVTSEQVPEIKDWKVGQTYKFEVTVKMTGIRQRQMYDFPMGSDSDDVPGEKAGTKEKESVADFQVTGIEVDEESDADEKTEELKEKFNQKRGYNA